MDRMFEAHEAKRQATREAGAMQDLQKTGSQQNRAPFDDIAHQRRLWKHMNEQALQVTPAV